MLCLRFSLGQSPQTSWGCTLRPRKHTMAKSEAPRCEAPRSGKYTTLGS